MDAPYFRCPAAEIFRQILEGSDYDTPHGLLRTISPAMSVVVPPGAPYSIGANIAHADHWQTRWLRRLRGEHQLPLVDWPEATEKEWPDLLARFCDGLREAYEIAGRDPFTHGARDDELAVRTLFKIANHGAYHLGQVKLLKRLVRSVPAKTGSENTWPPPK